jgi:hypothetical protein
VPLPAGVCFQDRIDHGLALVDPRAFRIRHHELNSAKLPSCLGLNEIDLRIAEVDIFDLVA